jgi:hypothetical protein
MYSKAELLLDQSRQFACPDRLARNEPRRCHRGKRDRLKFELIATTRIHAFKA